MSTPHVAPPRAVDLSRVNLNLLVALDALLTEASVTKAATRLGLTQSALSHALRQLREVFGDALLIRGRGGMVLTPRAQQLAVPIRRGLLELQRALRDEPVFEPRTTAHRFTLATSDYFASILLPSLLALLGKEAPQVDLDLRPIDPRWTPELLESGAVDLIIQAFPNPAPALRQQKLFQDEFACLVRKDHPEVNRRLELAQYLRLPHALISPQGQGDGIVDQALAKQGLSRRIALRIPFFLAAPLVITRSDLVLTAPRRMVESFAQGWPLQVLKPPLTLPTFSAVQLWHERYEDEPAHRWLRNALLRATAHLS
ncbi:LysR family transcriptional regulator [Stigmatella sp. ncwal1]|uniref:LysR family transcriptional regulator n=1 Tax=Stigmatella ashevillensis TaxID=2995309 RepID=A0ABT5DI10_9BACT|nr:LysR family transcriptional regulator [Stigmatella ashevillena]MDC0713290.1 LysR family transcriptional regulator [Stigmatella ashevillena]